MNLKKLSESGINYEEGVERFCGQEELYENFLFKLFNSNDMNELDKLIQEKNIKRLLTYPII